MSLPCRRERDGDTLGCFVHCRQCRSEQIPGHQIITILQTTVHILDQCLSVSVFSVPMEEEVFI